MLLRIGRECRIWREKFGVTHQEIADILDMSRQAISQFELGENDSATILRAYYSMGFPDTRIAGQRFLSYRVVSGDIQRDYDTYEEALRFATSTIEMGIVILGYMDIISVDVISGIELFTIKRLEV